MKISFYPTNLWPVDQPGTKGINLAGLWLNLGKASKQSFPSRWRSTSYSQVKNLTVFYHHFYLQINMHHLKAKIILILMMYAT